MMRVQVAGLRDSHVHLFMVGERKLQADLSSLSSSDDLKDKVASLKANRGGWLVGFGWDEFNWPEGDQNLSKEFLDQLFPHHPVIFGRVDGHRAWVNSSALETFRGSWHLPHVVKTSEGKPTGILLENAYYELLGRLPPYSKSQIRECLLRSKKEFHEGGFTHVRDMSTSQEQWSVLCELASEKNWSLFVETHLVCESLEQLDERLRLAKELRKSQGDMIQLVGIKIFYDGSLGSETALISKAYGGAEGRGRGRRLWEIAEIENAIKKIWAAQFQVAVHVIGDQAVDEVVEAARTVSSKGFSGELHLEHVEVLRPETIKKMKGLHVHCHMQPCHLLSDSKWLKAKLPNLWKFSFPLEALRRAQIPMSFGSDAPIEPINIFRNLKAISLLKKFGLPEFKGEFFDFHAKKEGLETSDRGTHTLLDLNSEKILETWVEGQRITF